MNGEEEDREGRGKGGEGIKLEDWGRRRVRQNSFDWSSDDDTKDEAEGTSEERSEGSEISEDNELGLGKYFWKDGVGIRRW